MSKFQLSEIYRDFCDTVDGVDADFLEGTTASGKTTIGAGVKFMRMVSRSSRHQHIIAAKTTGVAEKNILNSDNGIMKIHKTAVYCGNGDKTDKLPHIKFEGKIIYVLGYDNRDKWENALGGQYGCVYIDEINTADMEFVREVAHRNEYLMATLNPDNPILPVYDEFINRSRPYAKYADRVPVEIMNDLKQEPVPKWRYWFFSFADNLGLTAEDIARKIAATPKGTKIWKNKILGLRGKATGLIFPNFDRNRHVVSAEWLKRQINIGNIKFKKFTAGLDTSYSAKSPDTIAMVYQGITVCRKVITLAEQVYSNADLAVPLAPSDTVVKFIDFLDINRNKWGFAKDVFIDSADQATITELRKHKRLHGSVYNFHGAWKETKIIDRIELQLGWLQQDAYLVVENCVEHIGELDRYSWAEDNSGVPKDVPEDRNDHTINASQYSWLPYVGLIGGGTK